MDPFCGSGTISLDSSLLGRNAVGLDINPLSVLITQVKTTPLDMVKAKPIINCIIESAKHSTEEPNIEFPNIDFWFSEPATNAFFRIQKSIELEKNNLNEKLYRFLLVCFSSIIRKSSNPELSIAKTYRSKRVVKKIANG